MVESRDFAALRFANKDEARTWLSNRYDEQVQLNPYVGVRFTKDFYVRRNLRAAMQMEVQA